MNYPVRLTDEQRRELIAVVGWQNYTPHSKSLLYAAVESLIAQERERCALTAENASPRHTECGNKIAAAIRKGGA